MVGWCESAGLPGFLVSVPVDAGDRTCSDFARFLDIFFFLKKFYAYETPRNPLRIHDGYSGKLFSIV